MKFENINDVCEYIEDHSINIVEELPSCDFCYNLIDSHDGVVEYCTIEDPDGGYDLIFCCEDHMNEYFKRMIKEYK